MPLTAKACLREFRKNYVDLDPEETGTARTSRDYLTAQISTLSKADNDFPRQFDFIHYGSFARRTKIRPLNDIDLLMLVMGEANREVSGDAQHQYRIKITQEGTDLEQYANEDGYVNSRLIVERTKSHLSGVPHYSKAEVKRDHEAVTLSLSSYPWVFDIVPAVPVGPRESSQVDYYLIPDGSGNWKRTDPRIDQQLITAANQDFDEALLPVIRLMKYWNERRHKRVLGSYYFETLVRTALAGKTFFDYEYAVYETFDALPDLLRQACPDPKELGEDLDEYVAEEFIESVANAATQAMIASGNAILQVRDGDETGAVGNWQRVFGPNFPSIS